MRVFGAVCQLFSNPQLLRANEQQQRPDYLLGSQAHFVLGKGANIIFNFLLRQVAAVSACSRGSERKSAS